jgi:F0F1-type ATP synthase assembly protein I
VAAGRNKMLMEAGRAASAGYFMIIAMLLGAGAGYAADVHFETPPWGLLVGFGLGMAAGFRELYQIARTTHLNKPTDGGGSAP